MRRQPDQLPKVTTVKRISACLLAAIAAVTASNPAFAGPAQTSGFSTANVVDSAAVVPIDILRFGQFIRPTAAGTLAVANGGAVTTTGGVTGNTTILQTGLGRGPGSFMLTGGANRFVLVALPGSMTISNGAQSMTVNGFNTNTIIFGLARLDATGHFDLNVGATLNVGANQAAGNYTGTYTVTVTYF